MKISIVRTGGVGGMRKSAQIDTTALAPHEAQNMARLIADADVPGIAEPTISVKGAADRFQYTLTLEDGPRTHALTFQEENTPQRVRPLLDAVWRLADANDRETKNA